MKVSVKRRQLVIESDCPKEITDLSEQLQRANVSYAESVRPKSSSVRIHLGPRRKPREAIEAYESMR